MQSKALQNNKRKLADISNSKIAASKALSTKGPSKPQVHDKMTDKSKDVNKSRKDEKTTEKKGKIEQKDAKKVLTSEKKVEMQEQSEEIDLGQSQVIIGNMFSLYALADKQPSKIKTIIDSIFSHEDNSEEFVVKTMFLYFLELMGQSEVDTLHYNVQYIAKNTEEKRLLDLFNEDEQPDISFDKLIFFSQERKALEQKKLLKRVCKIFVADVVDLLPAKASYLSSVVQRVCVYSKSQHRLVRYTFTFIGLYLYKFILGQQSELSTFRKNYEDKFKDLMRLKQKDEATKTLKQKESIEEAMQIIQENLDNIQKYLILRRCQDTTSLVRKSVYEFFLQLDEKEVHMAFTKDNIALFDMIFTALTDEDPQIRKISLQMVAQILNKMNSDQQTLKMIETNIQRHKLQILKMAIPTDKNQDNAVIVKALQVIQRMIQMLPNVYNQENIQMLLNLVHYNNQSVREEVGDLLLIVSQEFDDSNSLIELQKISANKTATDTFVLNFLEEPNKSQKQILKLIKMFEQHVQTRSQYIKQHKCQQEDGGQDDEEIVVPNMQREEVQRILQSDCEERAFLLFQTFYRKTSVLYDVQSLCNLLTRDDGLVLPPQHHVLAHLINTSLTLCNQLRLQKDQNNQVYQKLWEMQTGYLKLTVMNELLQTFRVDAKILDPLLKAMLTLGKTLEKDNSSVLNEELAKELNTLLMKIIEKTEVKEESPESLQIIKSSILNLAQLQEHFPMIRKELQEMAINYNEELQLKVIPQMFNSRDGSISKEAISFIHKFNILMSQISIKQISDTDYLKGMASYAITNYTQMISDNFNTVSQLSKSSLSALLQLPFTFIDQLLTDSVQSQQHIQFQTEMLRHLVNLYLELYQQFKPYESLQVVILKFIIECLILAGGENNMTKSAIVLGLNDFPKVKEFLTELIQNVSGRLKGNDSIVQEQFQLLLSLFMRDFNSLLSETGVEFLINFGVSKDPVILKDIRKLYYSYKQRDRLLSNTNKSIFYSFISKCVITIYKSADTKIYRLLDQAPGDIQKELVQMGLDQFNPPFTLQTYSKLVFIQNFIKNFLNSIMLLIISTRSSSDQCLTRQQDEFAYFKMIEAILRYTFQEKANYPVLLSVKYLMHKNFLSKHQQEGVIRSLKEFVEAKKENLNLTHDETQMIHFLISKIQEKVIVKKVGAKGTSNDNSVATVVQDQSIEEERNVSATKQNEVSEAKSMIGLKRKTPQSESSMKKSEQSKKDSDTGRKVKKVK